MEKAKPFCISKRMVWEAYKRVKANRGAAGVDGQSIEEFESDLENNLYKLWNRMCSGSYFPPPVRRVEIPKKGDVAGTRPLGVPTVADRIAQTVCKMYLEPKVERIFHADSYAYRQKRAALKAVAKARKRCWKYDWVLDLDIRGFFDNIDHELMMRAVRKHTECKWVLLYIERWLKAPVQLSDGTREQRSKGTPQGSVISPLLANLFLHYAFDKWMERNHSTIPFERFADDIICHCQTEEQAKGLWREVGERLGQCRLELHPEKTKIVYCKDVNRPGNYAHEQFDFLGFTFRPRMSVNRKTGQVFTAFLPGVSREAGKAMRQCIRSWQLHRQVQCSIDDLARLINPIVQGWINYYGAFYKSELNFTFFVLERRLLKWARRKYKRQRGRMRQTCRWMQRIRKREPTLFAHWPMLYAVAGR